MLRRVLTSAEISELGLDVPLEDLPTPEGKLNIGEFLRCRSFLLRHFIAFWLAVSTACYLFWKSNRSSPCGWSTWFFCCYLIVSAFDEAKVAMNLCGYVCVAWDLFGCIAGSLSKSVIFCDLAFILICAKSGSYVLTTLAAAFALVAFSGSVLVPQMRMLLTLYSLEDDYVLERPEKFFTSDVFKHKTLQSPFSAPVSRSSRKVMISHEELVHNTATNQALNSADFEASKEDVAAVLTPAYSLLWLKVRLCSYFSWIVPLCSRFLRKACAACRSLCCARINERSAPTSSLHTGAGQVEYGSGRAVSDSQLPPFTTPLMPSSNQAQYDGQCSSFGREKTREPARRQSTVAKTTTLIRSQSADLVHEESRRDSACSPTESDRSECAPFLKLGLSRNEKSTAGGPTLCSFADNQGSSAVRRASAGARVGFSDDSRDGWTALSSKRKQFRDGSSRSSDSAELSSVANHFSNSASTTAVKVAVAAGCFSCAGECTAGKSHCSAMKEQEKRRTKFLDIESGAARDVGCSQSTPMCFPAHPNNQQQLSGFSMRMRSMLVWLQRHSSICENSEAGATKLVQLADTCHLLDMYWLETVLMKRYLYRDTVELHAFTSALVSLSRCFLEDILQLFLKCYFLIGIRFDIFTLTSIILTCVQILSTCFFNSWDPQAIHDILN